MKDKKPKTFWLFYTVVTILLAAAAAYPLWNFAAMVAHWYSRYFPVRTSYDVTAVVPFMAVFSAILIGFLVMPVLWNMPMRKKRALVSVGAVIVFIGLALLSETVTARLNAVYRIMLSRRWHSPEEVTRIISDAPEMMFPWVIRIHYYVFSIILILTLLNFLYSLANALFKDKDADRRIIIIQGIAMTCYALAYFLVRVMRYENHAALHLTWGSVLNAAVCFILAAVSVGLYSGSFLRFKGLGKFVPSMLSTVTVLALYGAQYAVLEGNLYSYSGNAAVTVLLRILVIVVPGAVTFFLLYCTAGKGSQGMICLE